MNLEEAAKILEVSEPYVLRLIAANKLSKDLTEEEVQRYYDSPTMRIHRQIRHLSIEEQRREAFKHLMIDGEENPFLDDDPK